MGGFQSGNQPNAGADPNAPDFANSVRRIEKVQALRGLLDGETRPAPEPRFATDWPA